MNRHQERAGFKEAECGCLYMGAIQLCRLHVAAPALLEALNKAADCLEQVTEAYQEEVEQARAAIAQAMDQKQTWIDELWPSNADMMQRIKELETAIRVYRALWLVTHEGENAPSAETNIRLGYIRGQLFGMVRPHEGGQQ